MLSPFQSKWPPPHLQKNQTTEIHTQAYNPYLSHQKGNPPHTQCQLVDNQPTSPYTPPSPPCSPLPPATSSTSAPTLLAICWAGAGETDKVSKVTYISVLTCNNSDRRADALDWQDLPHPSGPPKFTFTFLFLGTAPGRKRPYVYHSCPHLCFDWWLSEEVVDQIRYHFLSATI